MRVAIRVDASPQIGTGHFIRCLALAEELRKWKIVVRFICRHIPDHFKAILFEKKYELTHLEGISNESPSHDLFHSNWLGTSQYHDAQETIHALSGNLWDWIVIDHYALDERWETELRQITKKIFVIDDLADRHHDCDILLDQNLLPGMERRYDQKVPSHCQLLLGPRYALLRDEFRILRKTIRPRNVPPKKVLIFFGGVDFKNFTELAIKAFSSLQIPTVYVDVVIGNQHPKREVIRSLCNQLGYYCHVQTDRMAELVAEADFGIGAGGTALWERCCLGLPTFTISTADNQMEQVLSAAAAGIIYSPEGEAPSQSFIESHLRLLWDNSSLRRLISKNSMKIIDGRGSLRVTSRILSSYNQSKPNEIVGVRLAVLEDGTRAWQWRNSYGVRKNSFDSTLISLDDHLIWWKKALSDPARTLLICQFWEKDVGVIRFDFDNESAVISIYLDPEFTGLGLGSSLIQLGKSWILKNRPKVKTILANILPNNEASIQAFEDAGFHVSHFVLAWTRSNKKK